MLSLLVFLLPSLALTRADQPLPEDVEALVEEQLIPYPPFREEKPNDRLLMVQVVWRHGDRAPTLTYPTDPHKESAWNYGWGELTELGMRQQYALGRVLNQRYINKTHPIINPRYIPKEVYFRSTDVNRTLMSAYANIAGFFAQGDQGTDFPDYPRWPTHWTPVPVHTMPEWMDYEGNVFAPCPRADELTEQLKASAEYKQLASENSDLLTLLSEKAGMTVNLGNIYLINDAHYIEKLYNLTQPEWYTNKLAERVLNLTRSASEYLYGISKPYCPELIKLRGGPLLKHINDLFRQKLSCDKKKMKNDQSCNWILPLKLYTYSAHDTTVSALLATFGDERRVIKGGLPHYTASVALELWDLEGEGPAVKILFHGAFHHNYHTITHLTKGCPDNEFCPFDTFQKRSSKFEPHESMKVACRRHVPVRSNRVPV